MSGFIRVRLLPTLYEVRTKHAVERFCKKEHAVEEHGKRKSWEQSAKFVTVRRWQVERTEVFEERYEHFTSWTTPRVVIEVILRRNGWILSLRTDGDDGLHIRREEAEAAARTWLHENGYRIRKEPTR